MSELLAEVEATGAVVVAAMATPGAMTRPAVRTAAILKEAMRDFMEEPFTVGGHSRRSRDVP